jgi:hypothetical protein
VIILSAIVILIIQDLGYPNYVRNHKLCLSCKEKMANIEVHETLALLKHSKAKSTTWLDHGYYVVVIG